MTSSYYSPNLDSGFALALVADGRRRLGQTVYCVDGRGLMPMKIVEPVFFDKEGARRDGID